MDAQRSSKGSIATSEAARATSILFLCPAGERSRRRWICRSSVLPLRACTRGRSHSLGKIPAPQRRSPSSPTRRSTTTSQHGGVRGQAFLWKLKRVVAVSTQQFYDVLSRRTDSFNDEGSRCPRCRASCSSAERAG